MLALTFVGLAALLVVLTGWKRVPHDLNISPNWLMLAGGLVWLLGELWGVKKDSAAGSGKNTTSEWVWWLEDRPYIGIPIRILAAVFLTSLVAHLSPAHTPLMFVP